MHSFGEGPGQIPQGPTLPAGPGTGRWELRGVCEGQPLRSPGLVRAQLCGSSQTCRPSWEGGGTSSREQTDRDRQTEKRDGGEIRGEAERKDGGDRDRGAKRDSERESVSDDERDQKDDRGRTKKQMTEPAQGPHASRVPAGNSCFLESGFRTGRERRRRRGNLHARNEKSELPTSKSNGDVDSVLPNF